MTAIELCHLLYECGGATDGVNGVHIHVKIKIAPKGSMDPIYLDIATVEAITDEEGKEIISLEPE